MQLRGRAHLPLPRSHLQLPLHLLLRRPLLLPAAHAAQEVSARGRGRQDLLCGLRAAANGARSLRLRPLRPLASHIALRPHHAPVQQALDAFGRVRGLSAAPVDRLGFAEGVASRHGLGHRPQRVLAGFRRRSRLHAERRSHSQCRHSPGAAHRAKVARWTNRKRIVRLEVSPVRLCSRRVACHSLSAPVAGQWALSAGACGGLVPLHLWTVSMRRTGPSRAPVR